MFQILSPIYLFIIIVTGLILGSFLNMLIYRLPRNMNWTTDRSKCPSCKHVLQVLDLFPFFSFVLSLGRCRHCKTPIPIRYLLVEIITPALLILAYSINPGFTLEAHALALFYLVCVAVFFIDLETTLIPNELSIGLVIIGLLYQGINGNILQSLIGLIVGYSVFWLIATVSKRFYKQDTMGGGDLKLAAGIGAFWGPSFVLITSYLSFLIGAFIGIIALIVFKKKRTDAIPFGPMIVLAAIIVSVFEEKLLSLFLNT